MGPQLQEVRQLDLGWSHSRRVVDKGQVVGPDTLPSLCRARHNHPYAGREVMPGDMRVQQVRRV